MTELKDLTPGTLVKGVTSDSPVEVVSVKWFGDSAIELTYKVPATGAVGNQLVYRDAAVSLDIVEQGLPWSSRGENMKSLPKVPTTRLDDQGFRRVARVFQMVHELHKVGYQGLRACPQEHDGISYRIHLSPSIFMTHTTAHGLIIHALGLDGELGYGLTDVVDPQNTAESLTAHYSSAMVNQYFGWEDGPGRRAGDLANLFVERFPKIARLSLLDDHEYAGWFQRLIGEIEKGWYPLPSLDLESGYYGAHSGYNSSEDETDDYYPYQESRLSESIADEGDIFLELHPPHSQTDVDNRRFPLPPPVKMEGDLLHRLIRELIRPQDQNERP